MRRIMIVLKRSARARLMATIKDHSSPVPLRKTRLTLAKVMAITAKVRRGKTFCFCRATLLKNKAALTIRPPTSTKEATSIPGHFGKTR